MEAQIDQVNKNCLCTDSLHILSRTTQLQFDVLACLQLAPYLYTLCIQLYSISL